jgi:hypothetical protein
VSADGGCTTPARDSVGLDAGNNAINLVFDLVFDQPSMHGRQCARFRR